MKDLLAQPVFQEASALMDRHDPEPRHAEHVCKLADSFFLQLKAVHGLEDSTRLLLAAGALLHDTGWSLSPSGKKHHKLSARLIREHSWKTLKPGEVEIVALIARYHRKSLPGTHHEPYAALDEASRSVVRRAAALLRIADSLDRSHQRAVRQIQAVSNGDTILIRCTTKGNIEAEQAAFEKKRDLFDHCFRQKLRLSFSQGRSLATL